MLLTEQHQIKDPPVVLEMHTYRSLERVDILLTLKHSLLITHDDRATIYVHLLRIFLTMSQ